MKILLSGFEPFGGETINPSQKILETLPDQMLGNVSLVKVLLPVDRTKAPEMLLSTIGQSDPDAVLSLGLAHGRSVISLERVAINLLDFRIADNAGSTVKDQPIFPSGPTAYFSSLPLAALQKALAENGIPSKISLSAGAFLCNQVFYTLMHQRHQQNLSMPAGFIHLPALPEQAASGGKEIPTMSLQTQLQALHVLISVLKNTTTSTKKAY
jgi:pyroglutamyl-peptidase